MFDTFHQFISYERDKYILPFTNKKKTLYKILIVWSEFHLKILESTGAPENKPINISTAADIFTAVDPIWISI